VLTRTNVAAYLIERGLLDPAVVNGVRVLDVSGRNRVFVVTRPGASGYVVKQSGPRHVDLVAREAVVLRQIVASERRLAGCVPTPILFDPPGRLVCELVGDATDLSAYHARGRFSPLLARRVAEVLALVHGLAPDAIEGFPHEPDTALHGVPQNPPTLEVLFDLSDASIELLRLMQGSGELCERLAELEGSWHQATVVHGDMRSSNCVAFAQPGARRRTRIALVDWEAARGGDPHVDLGVVLGEYLHVWLWSMSVLDGRDLHAAPRTARHPLSAMRPAIGTFWHTYIEARHVRGGGPQPSLRRAMEFSAGRLVEVAFERAQMDAGLDPRAGIALQLGLNILTQPSKAASDLFGLAAVEEAR